MIKCMFIVKRKPIKEYIFLKILRTERGKNFFTIEYNQIVKYLH